MNIWEKLLVGGLFAVIFMVGWKATDFVKDAIRGASRPETEYRFSVSRENHDGIAVRVLKDKKTGAEYIVTSYPIIQTK